MKTLVALATIAALALGSAASAAPAQRITLPDGRVAFVDASGIAQVWSPDRRTVMYRKVMPSLGGSQRYGAAPALPAPADIARSLMRSAPRAYAPDEVLVQFRPGVTMANDRFTIPKSALLAVRRAQLVPQYTNDAQANRTFAKLGVDRSLRFAPNAYRVHLTASSVTKSVAALRTVASVSYASPNWYVETARASAVPIPRAMLQSMRTGSRPFSMGTDIPTNYAVSASAQSMLNAPGVDAVGAYDEISRTFHQLPGQGEIVTNVSLGDLTDASAVGPTPTPRAVSPSKGGGGGGGSGDPCAGTVAYNGPTTVLVGGQRYIDWPSMPLIPAYTSDETGALSGSAEVCNSPDGGLGEVGLDFSVMAPLPHQLQRPSAQGAGFTDLLGIAPGASYRLIVPRNPNATIADIDAALLAAALQNPRPNVITASLGFGFDGMGFPGRYLEEDPLTNAIVTSIVQQYGIVACIAANDGLRIYTNAAIAPSGGSAATNVTKPGGLPSDLNDVAFSTAPSSVFDSGAIDAGGTTLDDIFAAPPQNPQNAAFASQHTFPVTRYDGETTFSSGFGARVNVSAPADNIPALSHHFGGDANAVDVFLEGGTSASAPEVAAAAAVVLQVARLTGRSFNDARAVRQFLIDTASSVPNAPQSDEALHVGPQIDVTAAVETLLRRAGKSVAAAAPRVAVEQRRPLGLFGGVFVSDTDPGAIDLAGPLDANGVPTGDDQLAWITIAPDWEGVSDDAQFTLSIAGKKKSTIATGRWARVLPSTILQAAGFPAISSSTRTVTLNYEARDRGRTVSVPVSLTFGAGNGTSVDALAPAVESVVRGDRIAVAYDLTGIRNVTHPLIIVSSPGRINPATGFIFHPTFVAPLTALKGTVYVPVSQLQGDGVYGIALGLRDDPNGGIDVSSFAYTHVLRALHNVHANAPLVSSGPSVPGHSLEIPYAGSFTVNWDVSNIPGATGALLEISAPGPTGNGVLNPFNNPGGTIRDANGVDFGSVYAMPVSGARGSVTLAAADAHLVPTMNHTVRVIPLAGTLPAGEASDVSTVAFDGVVPEDGGILENGYGINADGNDGFLTSSHIADNTFFSSVETFNQKTSAVNIAQASSIDLFSTTGSGVWGNDIGIAALEDLTIPEHPPSATTYRLMNPVTANALGTTWAPPVLSDGVSRIVQTAPNDVDATAVALSGDPVGSATIPYQLFTSNLASGTFGPAYNLTAALPSGANAFAIGLAQDTATHTGYVAFANFDAQCGAPAIASVDLKTGKIATFNGSGQGFPLDIAIDSVTHKAAYQSQCDNRLNVFDLATHSSTNVPLKGGAGLYNAVDPVHHLIAVELAGGDSPPGNNNQMSAVLIYDEHGNLIKNLEQFNFYNIGLAVNANNLQVNPKTRTGFMFGPGATQLEPFKY